MGLTEALLEIAELSTLTSPATSASAEISFSAQRIQTYQRNTEGQDRLSGLSLLSVGKKLIKLKNKTYV
jgi:hypothetical protein